MARLKRHNLPKHRVRSGGQSQPKGSIRAVIKVLESLLNSVGDLLHPAVYQRLLSQAGEQMAYQLPNISGVGELRDAQAVAEYLKSLLSSEGWTFSNVLQKESEIELIVQSCPFGELGARNANVCKIESGLIQGIAKAFSVSARTRVERGEGSPPCECRFKLLLEKGDKKRVPEAEEALHPGYDVLHELLANHGVPGSMSKLSDREHEVFNLVGDGLSDKEIAGTLSLSVRTVQGHVARIRQKLGIRSRTHLLRLSLLSKRSQL